MRLIIQSDFRDGFYNMALDQALSDSVRNGDAPATVRFYGWNPPAVSLGRNQPAADIDREACRRAGVDVVRRPTGGRAVFHKDEFTYSVAAREDDPVIGGTVLDTYRMIALALLAGLKELGVPAQLVRSETRGGSIRDSASCFAAAGRYEITVDGRKIVGSAQRRVAGVILQQGSLILSQPQNVPLLKNAAVAAEPATLEAIVGRTIGFAELAGAMGRGFRSGWGVELNPEPVTPGEERQARELAARDRTAANS